MHKRTSHRTPAACAQVSIPATDMNDDDEELIVFCRDGGNAHDLPIRHHADLRRLRGAPDFAGLVIVDGGKVRCPRCSMKLDWRPTHKPLRVVR